MSAAEAWENLKAADADKDIDDFKAAFFSYARAVFVAAADGQGDSIDLADLEHGFRSEGMNMHFIGKVGSESQRHLRHLSHVLLGARRLGRFHYRQPFW
jgi:hypothetical protein